jgi:hypothetical protein
MEVDDTRVRYTLPFGWIGLVLARWSSTTGCFAGIGGLDTLSVGNVLGRVLSRILGFGANGFPSFRCLFCSYSSTRTYSMIQTASRPRIIGNGKVDHHGVGTARVAFKKTGFCFRLSHRVERCIRSRCTVWLLGYLLSRIHD